MQRWSIPFVMRVAVTLLLLQILFCSTDMDVVVAAFVPPLSSTRTKTANRLMETVVGRRRLLQQRSIRTEAATARTSKTGATTTDDTTTAISATTTTTELYYDVATHLMDLVLEKRNQDIEPPFEAWRRRNSNTPSYEQLQKERSSAIEALIEQLTLPVLGGTETTTFSIPPARANNNNKGGGFLDRLRLPPKPTPCYYDPAESLFGSGFYCTLYFYYPNTASDSGSNNSSSSKPPEDPIWEKTSLKASNIKGQQYYIRNDFQQSVINYSEVWGPDVTITAEGVLTPIDEEQGDKNNNNNNDRPLVQTKKGSRILRKLPDLFRVDATKISAKIFGLSLDFDIKGSANLVVLYADPRIRVFVSPLPSETLVGNWEEAGLVVVQVRGDLVPAENKWIPQLVDLR